VAVKGAAGEQEATEHQGHAEKGRDKDEGNPDIDYTG
jgi:hypothetical protein